LEQFCQETLNNFRREGEFFLGGSKVTGSFDRPCPEYLRDPPLSGGHLLPAKGFWKKEPTGGPVVDSEGAGVHTKRLSSNSKMVQAGWSGLFFGPFWQASWASRKLGVMLNGQFRKKEN